MSTAIRGTILLAMFVLSSACGDEKTDKTKGTAGTGATANSGSSGGAGNNNNSNDQSGANNSGAPANSGGTSSGTTASAETPPIGHAALTTWLKSGSYKQWACEPQAHPSRSPSPHGSNRICSNKLLSNHGDGAYPIGAATVKELYSGSSINGYAVMLRTKQGGAEGWYFYEIIGTSVVADGMGDAGKAKSACVGCHAGAGSDSEHSGHDFIYTQVK